MSESKIRPNRFIKVKIKYLLYKNSFKRRFKMKKKIVFLGLIIVFLTVFLEPSKSPEISDTPISTSATGTYIQKSNIADPFIFTVDTLYSNVGQSLTYSGIVSNYHQVTCEAGKTYLFYSCDGPVAMDNLDIEIRGTSPNYLVYQETLYDIFHTPNNDIVMYVWRPSSSNTFNITITHTTGSTAIPSFHGMGVLLVPKIIVGDSLKKSHWDFPWFGITIAILDLEYKDYDPGAIGDTTDIYYFRSAF